MPRCTHGDKIRVRVSQDPPGYDGIVGQQEERGSQEPFGLAGTNNDLRENCSF